MQVNEGKRLSELRAPLSQQDIETCIPHRYPFLLIDRVLDFERGAFITAVKHVTAIDPVLQGHFPGNPVMPGVLMLEGMAQASAVLGKLTAGDQYTTCYLTEVTDTRFRRLVVPGDTLQYHVRIAKSRGAFFWFDATASVGEEMAVVTKFSAKLA